MAPAAILPVAYLAPLPHYTAMLNHAETRWDIYEHFHKQHFYNRCMIYGANGPLKLIIPLHKRHEKTPLKDIRIKYEDNWQVLHWRSLEASYRRSPYFEYFEHELSPLYTNSFQPELLIDWNKKLFETVDKLIGASIQLSFTTEYVKTYQDADDYRSLASPAVLEQTENNIEYQQVFQEKHGFLPHLSIIDLLFCEGPHSKQLLLS